MKLRYTGAGGKCREVGAETGDPVLVRGRVFDVSKALGEALLRQARFEPVHKAVVKATEPPEERKVDRG